jgi:hypothetical protein
MHTALRQCCIVVLQFGASMIGPRLIAQQPATAPPAAPKFVGRVVGVYDDLTGKPLDSVEVRDMVSGQSALTTSTGTLSLFFVDTAGSLMRIRKVGYLPITMFVANSPDEPALTVMLVPLGQQLPTVVTTDTAPHYRSPKLQGFEERRKAGGGFFVPEAQLRKEESRPLRDVIRAHIPALEIAHVKIDSKWIDIAVSHQQQKAGKGCPVDIYLDGLPVSLSSTSGGTAILATKDTKTDASNDLNDFQTLDLAGVEFHNVGDVPVEYNRTSSGCGVLLLWSRER